MHTVDKVSAFIAVTKALEAGKEKEAKEMKKIISDSIEKEIKYNESFTEYQVNSNQKKLFMI